MLGCTGIRRSCWPSVVTVPGVQQQWLRLQCCYGLIDWSLYCLHMSIKHIRDIITFLAYLTCTNLELLFNSVTKMKMKCVHSCSPSRKLGLLVFTLTKWPKGSKPELLDTWHSIGAIVVFTDTYFELVLSVITFLNWFIKRYWTV